MLGVSTRLHPNHTKMKSKNKLRPVIAALFALPFVASAQDAAKVVRWYSFDIENHNPVAATSALTPEELAKALAGKDFIRLETVREFIGTTKWHVSVAPFTDTLFLRPTTVRSFVPLTGPPKDDSIEAK
jgi:hypothetical protein